MIVRLILYFFLSHLFSFLCSIFEAVLLSCTPSYIETLKKKGSKQGLLLYRLSVHIDRPLAAILTLNTISHTFGAVGVGASVLAIFGDKYVMIGSVILTLSMLYWTEMLPKTIGALYWRRLAPFLAWPIQILMWLTQPFVFSFSWFARLLTQGDKEGITEAEIRGAVASGARAGVIQEQEQEMVENVLRLGGRDIGVLMIPRVDLVPLELEEGVEKNKRAILSGTEEQFLLCHGGLDRIIGILDIRDVLKAVWQDQWVDLQALARAPYFVHENQRVLELIELFETTQSNFALVIDEYGVIQGSITMHEIMQAIIKDIDESNTSNSSYFQKISSRCWILDGRMPIDEFKEIFEISDLPEEERARYRTLGGLCMTLLGAVPQNGDVFLLDPYRLEVLRAHRRRVEKLLLTRRSI